MSTSKDRPQGSREDIALSLERRSVELWGEARASALRTVIAEVAANIYRISQDPPPADEEPGFYF